MKSKLEALLNSILTSVNVEYNTLHLVFESGALNIYNDYVVKPDIDLKKQLNTTLLSVVESKNEVLLDFGSFSLLVDLTDSSFNGPEAMLLDLTSGETIVWN